MAPFSEATVRTVAGPLNDQHYSIQRDYSTPAAQRLPDAKSGRNPLQTKGHSRSTSDPFPSNTPATRAPPAPTNLQKRLKHRASKTLGPLATAPPAQPRPSSPEMREFHAFDHSLALPCGPQRGADREHGNVAGGRSGGRLGILLVHVFATGDSERRWRADPKQRQVALHCQAAAGWRVEDCPLDRQQ